MFSAIYFEGVTSQIFNEDDHTSGSLIFENCDINFLGIRNKTKIRNYISFSGGTIGGVQINHIEDLKEGLFFTNVIITSFFGFLDNEIAGSIQFKGNTFKQLFKCVDNKAKSLHLSDNIFEKEILIEGGILDIGLFCIKNTLESLFKIERVNSPTGALTIGECNFSNSCQIFFISSNGLSDGSSSAEKGFAKIYLWASSFKGGCELVGSRNVIAPYAIDQLTVICSAKLEGNIVISNISIRNTLNISGVNFKANIILRHVYPSNVLIDGLSNYASMQFIEFRPYNEKKALFSISDSYLGKTQFSEVDFSLFDSVDIRNSHLSEIITSCVTWFEPSKLLESGIKRLGSVDDISEDRRKNLAKLYSSKKEIFRQLKVAMEKHGSQADYLFFKQTEMDYYGTELKYSNGNLKDRFILLTNKTNDHGQNWLKPILLAIPVTVLFYFLIVIATSDRLSSIPSGNTQHIIMTLQEFWDRGRLFFVLFNPARSLDKTVGEGYITGFVEFLDLLHRILISYFIFQTVSAFRKYTKS